LQFGFVIFFVTRISAQKLLVKCWRSWLLFSISPTFFAKCVNLLTIIDLPHSPTKKGSTFPVNTTRNSAQILHFMLHAEVSISSMFYTRIFCMKQLFSSHSLALKKFGAKIYAQNFGVKCWWNWPQYEQPKSAGAKAACKKIMKLTWNWTLVSILSPRYNQILLLFCQQNYKAKL